MNIRIIQNPANKTFQFDILKGNKLILSGKDYPDKATCLTTLEKTLHSLVTNDMLNVVSVGSSFVFQANQIDSIKFKSLEDASDAMVYIKETGTNNNGKFTVQLASKQSDIISKKKIGTANEGYNFRQPSQTNKPGVELLDQEKAGLYYFHWNDDAGKPMLFSRVYDGKQQRLKAVRQLVDLVKEKKIPVKILPLKDRFVFVIKDLEGYEIARSTTYPSKEKAEAGIKYLKKQAKGKIPVLKKAKKSKKKKKKKKRQLPKQAFLLKQNAPNGSIGFESFRSKENKYHYFHYHDAKGKTLLASRAYESRGKRDEGIITLIELSQRKDQYTMNEEEEKYYFTIDNKKGKLIARSRYFDSKRDMILGMKHFLNKAPTYLDQKNTLTTNIIETIPLTINMKAAKDSLKKSVSPKSVAPAPTPAKKVTQPNKSTNKTINGQKPRSIEQPKSKSIERPQKVAPIRKKTAPAPAPKSKEPAPDRPNKEIKQRKKAVPAKPALKAVNPPPRTSTKVARIKALPPKPKPLSKAPPVSKKAAAFNWQFPLLLVLLASACYFLWRNCGQTVASKPTAPVEKKSLTKNVKPVKEEPVKKTPALLGPTGKALGYEEGTVAAKIANFLSLPASVFPKTFLLDKVHFDSNKDVLKTEAFTQLDRISQLLKAYPTLHIQINGHADNAGDADKNLQLSTNRANKVREYLLQNNIATDRIATKGFGATKPLSSNQTASGKYNNRRSELVLVRR